MSIETIPSRDQLQNVITYQSSNGYKLNLTPNDIREFEEAATWPRDPQGEEICMVSHGLHLGFPSQL